MQQKTQSSKSSSKPSYGSTLVSDDDLMIALANIINQNVSIGKVETRIVDGLTIDMKWNKFYIGRNIEKEKEIVDRMATLENKLIPVHFDYDKVAALSIEALQKFKKVRPLTLGQASRISGVNPSDVQILMVYMGR